MRTEREKGATLLTTLTIIGLGLILALTLTSSSISQLQKSRVRSEALRATRIAESVLALATERLVIQPDFAESATNFLEYDAGGSSGFLSFKQEQADKWAIPVSVNNREGLQAVDGWNQMRIPARAVQLVAVGHSGGVRRTVDAIVMIPEFPYALASSGPIASEGGLLIGGFTGDDVSELDFDELGTADLFSNATGEAVNLQGEVEITGDV
ncbi:MAG: hypothetical protein KC800_03915, partial [Candidatus Eremiobacteraeota bacterium]|nr:hypothetical protein [Candidatus Eremiobacteraeota bacterium]